MQANRHNLPPSHSLSRCIRLPLLGTMSLEAVTEGLLSFRAVQAKTELQKQNPIGSSEKTAILSLIRQAEEELLQYLDGKRKLFTVPLAPRGSPFQEKVWKELARIPYGSTATYGEVAKSIGGLHLARAVGHAAASNRLPLFIPCHRVLGKGGNLGGFSLYCEKTGGPELKQRLLDLERGLPFCTEDARTEKKKGRPALAESHLV